MHYRPNFITISDNRLAQLEERVAELEEGENERWHSIAALDDHIKRIYETTTLVNEQNIILKEQNKRLIKSLAHLTKSQSVIFKQISQQIPLTKESIDDLEVAFRNLCI